VFQHRGGKVVRTETAGEEIALASRALDGGAKTLVAVGGDGTCAKIANVILKRGADCSLAVLACGTGNDFAKTLGVLRFDAARIANLVESGQAQRIDVGTTEGGYFLNSCGFGFDAAVLEASNRVRVLKGDAVYIYSALRQLFAYRGIHVSRSDTPVSSGATMLMVTVSNGRNLGGAFQIAPDASVLDGRLDIAFFRDSNLLERVRLFAKAFRGTHLGMRSVVSERAGSISLNFSAPPMMEVDGELRQARSSTVQIECLPRALSVIAAPGFPL
jgi:diacylglycerol kinase (ATP)